MLVTCCSDPHNAPKDHPACDMTPGFKEAWAKVPGWTGRQFHIAYTSGECIAIPSLKLVLGDGNEGWQFTRQEIEAGGGLIHTDVQGNHDFPGSAPGEIVIVTDRGKTIALHGDIFDPFLVRWVGRPACWAVGKLERWWPDADVRLGAWFQERFGGGRHGEWNRYAEKAAEYAVKRGARQIVFGHLHQLRECDRLVDGTWVHVVCTGCCCDGRMDFVEVEV